MRGHIGFKVRRTTTAISLAIARNNGTSTFTGAGTAASPYTRATGQYLGDLDGLVRYTWTVTGTGTCYVTFDYSDDDMMDATASIKKNGVTLSLAAMPTGSNISRNFAVASGDVITISASGIAMSQYFSNVSVYAQ